MESFNTFYYNTVIPELTKELACANANAVPRLVCVHVNVGIGTYMRNHKDYKLIADHIALITGQQPVVTKARKAISNFKLREGQPAGITVTLRGKRMLDFVSRLTNVVLPRVRDFRGVPYTSFDSQGNYSLGIVEHTVFPEIPTDDEVRPFGIQVTVVTSAHSKEEGEALLRKIGFPFKKNPNAPTEAH